MKQNNITDLPKLPHGRLEQLFNVYQQDNGIYYYNTLNTVNFNIDNIDAYMYTTHTVTQGETYTLISYKYYNSINLWWLVCAFNGINDPTSLPEGGATLRILYPQYVPGVLKQINKV